ncbi:MAG: transposase family protein [Paenibacillus sp.]|uniref:integrase catalytic domain-containing protein n=1 Tax=Paenibacillus sp. TaxID=58172 RepID=UPI003B7B6BCF
MHIECEPYRLGKAVQRHHKTSSPSSILPSAPLQVMHLDVNGPWRVPTLDKAKCSDKKTGIEPLSKYMLSIIDGFSDYSWVYFYASKDSYYDVIVQNLKMLQSAYPPLKVARIRCDQAAEFMAARLRQYLADNGIQLLLSSAYAHEQAGVIERLQRTLSTIAKTILIESGLMLAIYVTASLAGSR